MENIRSTGYIARAVQFFLWWGFAYVQEQGFYMFRKDGCQELIIRQLHSDEFLDMVGQKTPDKFPEVEIFFVENPEKIAQEIIVWVEMRYSTEPMQDNWKKEVNGVRLHLPTLIHFDILLLPKQ